MLEKYFSQNRCLLISGLLFIYLKDFKTNNHGIFTPEIEKKNSGNEYTPVLGTSLALECSQLFGF